MAESQDDKSVDACIAEMQATLDRLKAEQAKDVADESSEDESAEGESETPAEEQPKSLREAERQVRVRAHYRKSRQQA